MTSLFTRKLAIIAVTTLAIAPMAAGFIIISSDAAHASPSNGKGNGNGNGGGRGNGNGGGNSASRDSSTTESRSEVRGNGNGRGAIASELKGMNAMNASPNAMANASPNSQVGRIATYRDAAVVAEQAHDEWTTAYNEYLNYEGTYDGPTSAEIEVQLDDAADINADIDTQIGNLDPASLTYADDVAALEAQKVDASDLDDALLAAQQYENELRRLMEASNALADEHKAATTLEADALLAASGGRTLSDAAMAELRATLGLE